MNTPRLRFRIGAAVISMACTLDLIAATLAFHWDLPWMGWLILVLLFLTYPVLSIEDIKLKRAE